MGNNGDSHRLQVRVGPEIDDWLRLCGFHPAFYSALPPCGSLQLSRTIVVGPVGQVKRTSENFRSLTNIAPSHAASSFTSCHWPRRRLLRFARNGMSGKCKGSGDGGPRVRTQKETTLRACRASSFFSFAFLRFFRLTRFGLRPKAALSGPAVTDGGGRAPGRWCG